MRKEIADLLTEDTGEVQSDYSGRGMYGKTTHAVVFDDDGEFEAALLDAAFELGLNTANDDDDLTFELQRSRVAELRNLRKDSMGLGIVVY